MAARAASRAAGAASGVAGGARGSGLLCSSDQLATTSSATASASRRARPFGAASVSATVRPSDLPVVGSMTSSAASALWQVAFTSVTVPSGAGSTSVARSSIAAIRCASRASAASHPTMLIETRGRSRPDAR